MQKIYLILLGLAASFCAQAEIYKHVDSEGRVTYSDRPIQGGVKLDIGPSTTTRPGTSGVKSKATATPSSFPRVDKSEQKVRDDKRRQILEGELATEREALQTAKNAYVEVEKHPEDYAQQMKGGGRNMTRYVEKLNQLSEEIKTHENNIEMLELELSRM